MTYITTKVQALKSYPTYQFYAAADSRTVDTDAVFRICILETLRWIRTRLQDLKSIPDELNAPGPDDYSLFSKDSLSSFSYNDGFQIDAAYIDSIGSWSFRITEPDMGANHGTERERLAVNGSSFTTEIAFLKGSSNVEIGIRTFCSEPSNTTAECEVFRPRVVKALAENPNLRLLHSTCIIDGKPLEIKSKTELERFLSLLSDQERCLPVVLVADSKTEISQSSPVMPQLSADKFSFSGFTQQNGELNVTISADLKNSFQLSKKSEKKPKENLPSNVIKKTCSQTKLPVFDYSGLANSLLGFAVVVFTDEKFFRQIENKVHISIDHGDILLITKPETIERFSYEQYRNDMQSSCL